MDEKLIKKYSFFVDELKREKEGIENFLDILSNFPMEYESRFYVGKEEFKLTMIEDAMEQIFRYLEELDKHLQILILQALFIMEERDIKEKLKYRIESK
ncbi:MAG: hypothetical protein ACTSU9_16870 [Promethearchaeota archaeon]